MAPPSHVHTNEQILQTAICNFHVKLRVRMELALMCASIYLQYCLLISCIGIACAFTKIY